MYYYNEHAAIILIGLHAFVFYLGLEILSLVFLVVRLPEYVSILSARNLYGVLHKTTF